MMNTFGAGHVANKDSGIDEFAECVEIDAPINHGNSGGPVFNRLGRVIGQATFSKPKSAMGDTADRQNFAVSVEMLLGLI